MKTFLEHVASDIVGKYGYDLAHTAVVFPNKRASLFLNDHLAHLADRPLWSPAYVTISDLFRQHSNLTVGDPIKLVCDLHKSFVHCTGIDETLDHFYGWGQVLLADFDDIDKNMADARQVFTNLKNLHELDDVSYLTAEQKAVLQRFFSNFTTDHDSRLKQKFLDLWSHFYDIYSDFRDRLRSQGIAYEGMLYRDVATDSDILFRYDRYLFVGFNMMQKVEQTLCRHLMQQGKARFYWDFDHYYLHDGEAGHFVSQYLQRFPNELDNTDDTLYSQLATPKDITYISAPTENIQARYVSHWLRQNGRIDAGRRTAIVMCNEGLLQTVVHCLPPETGKVNITTGYPLQQSPVCSFVAHLVTLQTVAFAHHGDRLPMRYVSPVLRHPCARFISKQAPQLLQQLRAAHRNFPTLAELQADEPLTLLFTPVGEPFNQRLTEWLLRLIGVMAASDGALSSSSEGNDGTQASSPDENAAGGASGGAFLQESLFRLYTLLNRLHQLILSGDLNVDAITLQRLMSQLIQSATIPFHGEPAEGIQVMGVLETRNLDFDHVLVLSCNEGNLPRGLHDSSFIPHSVRKAFSLTTTDHKAAIYACYFHHLLQRSTDVTILYNNSTEDGRTGEMSRFMLQLLVESSHTIRRAALQAGQTPTPRHPAPIQKSPRAVDVLSHMSYISPSAINRYQRCQLQFFYNYVAGITEPEANTDDEMDNRVFGNIFHESCRMLYSRLTERSPLVQADAIDHVLKHPALIYSVVDEAFRTQLFRQDQAVSHPKVYEASLNGLQTISREVIVRYVTQLLHIDHQLAPFTILGLEHPVRAQLNVGDRTVTVGGTIDRIDLVASRGNPPRIRIIDYKTGRAPHKVPSSIDDIFDPSLLHVCHTDYYLQTLFYSLIVSRDPAQQHLKLPSGVPTTASCPVPVSPALLFIQQTHAEGYDPTLLLGKQPIADAEDCRAEFEAHINRILNDIFEPSLPFSPTDDRSVCQTCPYRALCRG